MAVKILIVNSSAEKNCLLMQAFKELSLKDFSFALWSSEEPLLEKFQQNLWPAKKVFLGYGIKNPIKVLLFFCGLPFLQFKVIISLAKLKIKHQLDLIVCLNLKEKIIITPLARILKIKIVWLEAPDQNYRQVNRFIFWLFKLNSKFSKLVAFNNFSKLQLINLGCREDKIGVVPPGVKASQYQENIFNKLAVLNQANFHRKYFSVGALATLDQKQKIETIFQAVKICLPVIPNIQLIIIGEGRERKNLGWLAKKMEIENLVWLVGSQPQLKKWLESFDIFLAAGEAPTLDDYGDILEAMAMRLPILAARNLGLEDLIIENKTGSLIEMDHSEMLARQIIKLYQDKKLRLALGKNGQERVNRLFTLNQLAANLEKIFKY
jgi:glycosyltransferase involved in cell wall biosynthesis